MIDIKKFKFKRYKKYILLIFLLFIVFGIYKIYRFYYKYLRKNQIVFVGSTFEKNYEIEYLNNYFSKYKKTYFWDINEKKLEIIPKMSFEEYKKMKFKDKVPLVFYEGVDNKKSKKNKDNNENEVDENEKNLIIYFGGNGETMYSNNFVDYFYKFKKTGKKIDTFFVCYPGYGCSSDESNIENFFKYSSNIAEFINTITDDKYSKIYIVGFSIGGVMAIDCASKINNNKVESLSLINAFSNLKDCVKHFIGENINNKVDFLSNLVTFNFDKMDNVEKIKNIKMKINIFYSSFDKTVDCKNSKILFDNALNCKDKNLYEICGQHWEWDNSDIFKIILGDEYSIDDFRCYNVLKMNEKMDEK